VIVGIYRFDGVAECVSGCCVVICLVLYELSKSIKRHATYLHDRISPKGVEIDETFYSVLVVVST
jgi:hypothetical protein